MAVCSRRMQSQQTSDNRMDKVIQIANLIEGGRRENPQRGRVYSAKGISPCLNGMGGAVSLNLSL